MHLMCIEGHYRVIVPYRMGNTLKSLIDTIQKGAAPERYVDERLNDTHFPQRIEGDVATTLLLVSFNHWWGCKKNVVGCLRNSGYVPANTAELLALRAQHTETRFVRSVALGESWVNERGYPQTPCVGSGAGDGLRLRDLYSGWAPFWKFVVKKTESE